MSGDIFGCHNSGSGCYWHLMSGDPDVTQHPTVPGTAPATENHPAPNVKKPKVLKIQSRSLSLIWQCPRSSVCIHKLGTTKVTNNRGLVTKINEERKKVKSLSCVWLLATPWTVTCRAPPSTGSSRQEYWRVLPCPSPGDLFDPGIDSHLLHCKQTLPSEPPQEAPK